MRLATLENKRLLVLCLALACFVLLFVGGPGPYSSRTFAYGWGLGHLFCFALWASLYLGWRRTLPLKRQFAEVLCLAFLLGGATELLQAQIGREASWQDLGNDLLGSLLLLVFSLRLRVRIGAWRIWLFRIPVLLVVVWVMLPFLKVTLDDLFASQQFPLLAGFETPFEKGRWIGNSRRRIDYQHAHSGQAAQRIDLNTDRYSGAALRYFPADWSHHRALRFHIYNPESEPFELYFRIHDQHHVEHHNRYSDRFNTSLVAAPGWTDVEIPLAEVLDAPRGRPMDLTRIAGIVLFVGKLERQRTIYLDDVELIH